MKLGILITISVRSIKENSIWYPRRIQINPSRRIIRVSVGAADLSDDLSDDLSGGLSAELSKLWRMAAPTAMPAALQAFFPFFLTSV